MDVASSAAEERIELEPRVFLLPSSRTVEFTGRRHRSHPVWPLPGANGKMGEAYERMIWIPKDERQEIVRGLRKALSWLRDRGRAWPGLAAVVPHATHSAVARQR